MLHESNEKNNVIIVDGGMAFDELYSKPYIVDEIKSEIITANALLVPHENFRDGYSLLFPETTNEFYSYLSSNKPDGLNLNIAISDDDFNLIEMHSEVLNLPIMLVQWVALPLLTSLIAGFLHDWIKRRVNAKNEHKANIKIMVEETKSKKVKTIQYQGDAESFSESMKDVVDKLFK
jgi:hypothetical protein